MSEMIERVGQALADACLQRFGSTWSNDVRWEFARVAIAAMREPSKEMIEPGYQAIHDCVDFYNYESGSGYSIEPFAAADVWRTMIAAATGSTEG